MIDKFIKIIFIILTIAIIIFFIFAEKITIIELNISFLVWIILFFILVQKKLQKISIEKIFIGILGLILGCLLSNLLFEQIFILTQNRSLDIKIKNIIIHFSSLQIIITLGFAYLGMVIGLKKISTLFLKTRFIETNCKILDTSVIIDGRILDICETGFLEGTLIIPQFVLDELQQVADSMDSLKRTRGKYGLDILNKLQKIVKIEIEKEDFLYIKEVDGKIIELAKKKNAKILTNDLNLSKIAQLQNITVLNINDLSTAMKLLILPGEEVEILISKEGKEPGQGIGYLDDGTMIIVEQGLPNIGKIIKVTVLTIHQTASGPIIFAKEKS